MYVHRYFDMLLSSCIYQPNIFFAGNQNKCKKKTKRRNKVKKKRTATSMPCANDLPVNAVSNSVKRNNQFENVHPGTYIHK